MSATTTQLLSSGKFYKLRYDTIPVKSASANVSFYTKQLKNAKFWVVTLLSQMSDIYNLYVKLTTDNKTTTGINYKELYDSKWDPMTLTNNTLYTPEFKFFL